MWEDTYIYRWRSHFDGRLEREEESTGPTHHLLLHSLHIISSTIFIETSSGQLRPPPLLAPPPPPPSSSFSLSFSTTNHRPPPSDLHRLLSPTNTFISSGEVAGEHGRGRADAYVHSRKLRAREREDIEFQRPATLATTAAQAI
jgi:hypothetical protein